MFRGYLFLIKSLYLRFATNKSLGSFLQSSFSVAKPDSWYYGRRELRLMKSGHVISLCPADQESLLLVSQCFLKSQVSRISWRALSKHKYPGPTLTLSNKNLEAVVVGQDLVNCFLKNLPS